MPETSACAIKAPCRLHLPPSARGLVVTSPMHQRCQRQHRSRLSLPLPRLLRRRIFAQLLQAVPRLPYPLIVTPRHRDVGLTQGLQPTTVRWRPPSRRRRPPWVSQLPPFRLRLRILANQGATRLLQTTRLWRPPSRRRRVPSRRRRPSRMSRIPDGGRSYIERNFRNRSGKARSRWLGSMP